MKLYLMNVRRAVKYKPNFFQNFLCDQNISNTQKVVDNNKEVKEFVRNQLRTRPTIFYDTEIRKLPIW